jgi:hypothetical protein
MSAIESHAICEYCGEAITLVSGKWAGGDGLTWCISLASPFAPHKPKEA